MWEGITGNESGSVCLASLRGQQQRDESMQASFAFAADEPSSKTKIDLLEER